MPPGLRKVLPSKSKLRGATSLQPLTRSADSRARYSSICARGPTALVMSGAITLTWPLGRISTRATTRVPPDSVPPSHLPTGGLGLEQPETPRTIKASAANKIAPNRMDSPTQRQMEQTLSRYAPGGDPKDRNSPCPIAGRLLGEAPLFKGVPPCRCPKDS